VVWDRRYDDGSGNAIPRSVVASPDGSRVFVTGRSPAANGTVNYATLAYDA
jgi:hypothetical protein